MRALIGCVADQGQALVCYSLPLEVAKSWPCGTRDELGSCEDDRSRLAEEQKRLAKVVRSSTRGAVIDIGAFAPSYWSRRELHELWFGVIRRYAERLILPQHWRSVDNYFQILQSGDTQRSSNDR